MEVQGAQIVVLSAIAIIGGGALIWLFLKPNTPISEPVESCPESDPIQEKTSAPKPERKYTEQQARFLKEKFHKKMVTGTFWAVGGTLVTILTYSAARNMGGGYVVAWGAIIFGLFDIIRGASGWASLKEAYPELFEKH